MLCGHGVCVCVCVCVFVTFLWVRQSPFWVFLVFNVIRIKRFKYAPPRMVEGVFYRHTVWGFHFWLPILKDVVCTLID